MLNSIKIGVNRTVPDNRNPICAKTDWDEKTKGNPYPDVSVIITYRDEPRSTLLRTVVSVLERSSKELIKEIILVDDNNDDITIGQELKIKTYSRAFSILTPLKLTSDKLVALTFDKQK